jgi:hypothetical protein
MALPSWAIGNRMAMLVEEIRQQGEDILVIVDELKMGHGFPGS